MNCRQFRERLQWYLAEALPGKWSEGMAAHAADCEECAEALAQAKHALDVLHNLPDPLPPDGLAARIKAATWAAASSSVATRRWAISTPALAAACAGLLICVSVVLFSYRAYRPLSTPPREVAVVEPTQVETSHPAPTLAGVPTPAIEQPVTPAAWSRVVAGSRRLARRASVASEPTLASGGIPESLEKLAAAAEPVITPAVSHAADTEMRLARLPRAEMPVNIALASPRTDEVAESSIADAPTVVAATEEIDLLGALVGGVVANIVVDKYVRDTVIEGNETLLRLATSTPTSSLTLSAAEVTGEATTE